MKAFRVPASLVICACILACHARAQRKPPLPESYHRWLNQEVVYIISDEERKEFLKLASDGQRDAFVKSFWEARNPVRGSEQNPFKEEIYRRIEYANETFGHDTRTPGWRTDMGRTYIIFGKPVSRAPFKGYSQMYPMELWFYENKTSSPSFPSFFYVLFYLPDDIGEYSFYHPLIDGPLKLVRGTQFNTNKDVYNLLKRIGGDIARAPFTLIPGEPIDTESYNPSMSGELIVNKILEFRNDPFELKRIREMRFLRERVNSWLLVADQQPLDLATIVVADPARQLWLDYGVLVDQPKFGRAEAAGNLVVNAGFRLLTEAGQLIVEDSEERAYPAFEGAGPEKKFRPFVLANRITVVPGKYKLEVILTNRDAGKSYKAEKAIAVGEDKPVTLAGPVLASSVRQAAKPDPNTPFQYFGVQFVPEAGRRFAPGSTVRFLFQVNVRDQGDRDYRVEYLVGHTQNRAWRIAQTDVVPQKEFRDGALIKSKSIRLAELPVGEYHAVISVKRGASPEVLASMMVPLRIVDEVAEPALYFLSNFQAAASSGVAAYIRGLEALTLGRQEEAAGYLQSALERMPSNAFAVRTLVQLYFNTRKYSGVTKLFEKSGFTVLTSDPETVAQVALSFWETGNADQARRILAAGNAQFPKNALLLAAAKKMTPPR